MEKRGISKLDLKRRNRMQILRVIRESGPISRVDVASALEITRAAVTIITNEMIEQGIIDKNGARLVSGQLTSEKAVAGKKPDVSAENDSESRPDESSVPDDESQAEINEWSNYDDPSQNENAADGFEYTDDGVGYYTDPMMTE